MSPFLAFRFGLGIERFATSSQQHLALLGGILEELDQSTQGVVFENEPVWQLGSKGLLQASDQSCHAEGIDLEFQQRTVGIAPRHELLAKRTLQDGADPAGRGNGRIRLVNSRRSSRCAAALDLLANDMLFDFSSWSQWKFVENVYAAWQLEAG